MTLKEKFEQFTEQKSYDKKNYNAEECEQIADDYAIDFAEWINRVSYRSSDNNWWLTQNSGDIKKTTEELLKMFKKEKEL
jgi:hypothetical protein